MTPEGSRTLQENFRRKLCKNSENIKSGYNVFLSVERKDETETRHKLAPIAKGPFPVTKIEEVTKTVVIECPNRSVERVSRSLVLLGAAPIQDV